MALNESGAMALQNAMKLARAAIQLDTESRQKEAYCEYLKSINFISQALIEDAQTKDEMELITPDVQKMLKLADQCLERIKSTAAKLGKVGNMPTASQETKPARTPSHRRVASDGGGTSLSFLPPEVFKKLQSPEMLLTKRSSKLPSPIKKTKAVPKKLHIRCAHRDLANASTSSSSIRSTSKKTNDKMLKSKTQQWKDKVAKTNPQKSEEKKTRELLYSRYYRAQCAAAADILRKRNLTAKEREEAEMWLKRKINNNETARIRMQRMNERKAAAGKKDRSYRLKKTQTRQQHEITRIKEAEKKRRQRSGYTQERKEAISSRRRELYAIKVNKNKMAALKDYEKIMNEKEEKLKEMGKQLKAKEIELANRNDELQNRTVQVLKANSMLPEEESLDFRTDIARNKALERVRKALPKRRSHCINTTLELIKKSSPTKAVAFREAGIGTENKLQAGVMEIITTGLQAPRNSSTRKVLASTLNALRMHKLQREFCRQSGISRKLLQKAHKLKAGRRPLSSETVKAIHEFYEVNSKQLPDEKLVSKKTLKPRHVMELSISQLHCQFIKAHPDMPVSASAFYKLRPKHVKSKQKKKKQNSKKKSSGKKKSSPKATHDAANHDTTHHLTIGPCAVYTGKASPEPEKLIVNDFVAVKFELGKNSTACIVYMAMVTDVRRDEVQVKFMRRDKTGFYSFTSECQATHPMVDIVQVMAEPSTVQVGRAFQYKFDEQDLSNISSKFVLK
ncbi:VPS9 domain-containing protein 1 isoform X1 [Scyliorhinus canicula]|uniref:VPS9 domain-containing protein 1 isoform X1 n=1 Tax=Scyliorhinus canicula TaxID=7830 RepID=UPI0018F77DD9|nr:VPS9 domain-containing protein 1 isoform X1 [Scyliorhinus canicula]